MLVWKAVLALTILFLLGGLKSGWFGLKWLECCSWLKLLFLPIGLFLIKASLWITSALFFRMRTFSQFVWECLSVVFLWKRETVAKDSQYCVKCGSGWIVYHCGEAKSKMNMWWCKCVCGAAGCRGPWCDLHDLPACETGQVVVWPWY